MSDVPSFNLTDITRRREAIYNGVMAPLLDQAINGELLDRLVVSLRSELPAGATRDAIFESVRYLAGQTMNRVLGYQVAWRLAGNLPALREGRAVGPWTVQQVDEWVPVQVTRCFTAKNRHGKLGYEYSFRVMAGTPCPLTIRAFWNKKMVKYVAARLGFSRRSGSYPFSKAEQLVGLRVLVKIDAARSRGTPEFHDINCPDSMVHWNRNHVLKLRLRVGTNRCPNGWGHACHRCAVGYQVCPAATHRLNYETGLCQQCNNSQAIFDPEEQSVFCINCTFRSRMAVTA